MSGGSSEKEAYNLADNLELVLNRGGFSLKGVTFAKKTPPDNLSADEISLNINKLNFTKKVCGKKNVKNENVIPDVITRRHCVSKVVEIFDPTGKITPTTATMKLDLHELVVRRLDWDDAIPDELRPIWISHFEMMKEIGTMRFKQAIIPEDAFSCEIETIDFVDSSEKLCCIAIYARFLKKDGTYSSQLVFSRSKIIPSNTTQP